MSNSVRPHRWQPTRLPHPWDSPGKNTGVGCHFLLQCLKVKSESEVTQLCPTLSNHGLQPTRLLCPWDFPGKSIGVGCHCLFSFLEVPQISNSCTCQETVIPIHLIRLLRTQESPISGGTRQREKTISILPGDV